MKEGKKLIKGALKKRADRGDKFESLVLDLALKKMTGAKKDASGVYYSKKQKHLIMASKTLEGRYQVAEGTEEIDDNAFWGCAFVEQIDIPQTVTRIGNEAFSRCVSLRKLVVPASVQAMGSNPFVDLDTDIVECQSDKFVVKDGLMYTADGKALVACLTDQAEIQVPEGVTEIRDFAFSRRRQLTSVVLPGTVEVIGSDAFSDCDALSKVEFPASVKTIEAHAFAECDLLKKVTFKGKVEHVSRTAFSNCELLRKIMVPKGKTGYYVKLLHVRLEMEDMVIESKPEKQDTPKPEKQDTPK